MSLRRYYTYIEHKEVIEQIFFILNSQNLENDQDCLICYENINEENVICHKCHINLHLKCIKEWFINNTSRKCPHCRTNWKFEIDIIEKPKPIQVELTEYSILPNRKRNITTVNGSISGRIPISNRYRLDID